jgi:hypothetical protein
MPRKDKSGFILQFLDSELEINIDIMVNKVLEIENSSLIL